MKTFFITYGNNLVNCYSKIEAEDYNAAREIAFKGTQGLFAFLYEGEEELQRLVKKYHLHEIEIQPMLVRSEADHV